MKKEEKRKGWRVWSCAHCMGLKRWEEGAPATFALEGAEMKTRTEGS